LKTDLNDILIDLYIQGMEYHYQPGLILGIDDRFCKDFRINKNDIMEELATIDSFYEIYNEDNLLIGMIATSNKNNHVFHDHIHVDMIFIKEEFRSNGYGLQSFKELKRLSKKTLTWSCYYNIKAESLYEKFATKYKSEYFY